MKKKNSTNYMMILKGKYEVVAFVLMFFIFFIIYVYIAFYLVSDLPAHASFARSVINKQGVLPGNFILYLLILIFSLFSTIPFVSKIILAFLLAFATTYRLYLVNQEILAIKLENHKDVYLVNFLFSMSLIFVFAIYNPLNNCQYFGRFVPTVWHNSTTLFLLPFALLLFRASTRQLEIFDLKRNNYILLYVFLNIFIKPSFFFVWVFVYPFFILAKYKLTKEFWYSMIPVFTGVFLLLVEYWYIYKFSSSDSSVIIAPFLVYGGFGIKRLGFAFITSFLFPMFYFIFNAKKVIRDKSFLMVYFCLIVSLLIYFLLAETGPRQSHGNFYWQVVICTWLLFYKSFIALLKDIRIQSKEAKVNKILLTIYFLHVISGFAYLLHYIITNNYC